ncbi:putative E3 ubiquitin-protein ligase RGLG3 [Paratrimastix pyriformis]|uniref:E3 ubiquitin-protein ligase RGLG3 n=1 Tax=Paratrimastix pyriformis TaxID=342808 RepID=A0ABQ8UW09_9EUKA|nr:putative E3 ubiquitin-protein ligase RGLG3 [Paratrimastix pyriformis]
MGCVASKSVSRHPKWNPDRFKTWDEMRAGLREAGLEASQLMFAIDFTKSNNWSGEKSFHQPLHTLNTPGGNPYERVITMMGTALQGFDDDNLIPAFGFGDVVTTDREVFSFMPDGRPCAGFNQVLDQYRAIVPYALLSGPSTLAPIIRAAVDTVRATGQYHILVVVTDGQVDDPKGDGAAIVMASQYPLSIVVVGVGDGPWDEMRKFDDGVCPEWGHARGVGMDGWAGADICSVFPCPCLHLPALLFPGGRSFRSAFDNFQFVEWNQVSGAQQHVERMDLEFAVGPSRRSPCREAQPSYRSQLVVRRPPLPEASAPPPRVAIDVREIAPPLAPAMPGMF